MNAELFLREQDYHLQAMADTKKYPGFVQYHKEMVEHLEGKIRFYTTYPTRKGRRMARRWNTF